MREYNSKGRILFKIFNYTFLTLVTAMCILPVIHILALSFSSSAYAESNSVAFVPKGFTYAAYKYVIHNAKFWAACIVTFQRLIIGIPLSLIATIMIAYPLSKDEFTFKARKHYVKLFIFVMIFNGGLVPTYLLVQKLNLLDSIWALVLPMCVNVYNAIIMMNFFRALPKEIEESALVDGAHQFTILMRLIIPLAKPCIATILLFTFMAHWNSWMDGRIYMTMASNYPLQTYLQGVLESSNAALMNATNIDALVDKMKVSGQNLRAAMLFVSMAPVLIVYPFLQKYFVTGLVMGSVKG